MSRSLRRFGAAWLLLGSAASAHAQAAPDAPRERTGPAAQPPPVPGWAEPSTIPAPAPETATAPPATARSRAPVRDVLVAGDAAPGAGVPPRRWRPPPAEASGLTLDHRRGEALDALWVRRQFQANGFSGEGRDLASAIALVQLLNRAFVTAGFVNSGLLVPDQPRLREGVLELRLVHGRLAPHGEAPVTVEFADGRSGGFGADYITRRFPSTRRTPISAFDVERDFRLLAESPAIRTVSADLRPGTRPGEARLHILVDPERRADFHLGYANDRSPSVGGERAFVGGYVRSLLASGDILSGEAGRTSGVEDVQLSYAAPFLSPRTSLNLRAGYNDAAVVDAPLLPLDISARDRTIEGGLIHRFLERPLGPGAAPGRWSPSRTLSAGILLAYRHQRSYLFGEPFSFAPGSENGRSRYAAMRLTGDYVMRGVDDVLALSATGTMGLGGTRSTTPGILNPEGDFLVGLIQANYARRLGAPGLELRARLAGQMASGILYSGERLSIGGQSSVRGYRENQFLVDSGAIGSVELGWTFSLAGRKARRRAFDWGGFSLSAFADAAVAWNEEPPAPARSFIASAGVGAAWQPTDGLRLSLAFAEPLRDVPRTGTRNLQDRGLHFRLVIEPLRLLDALGAGRRNAAR